MLAIRTLCILLGAICLSGPTGLAASLPTHPHCPATRPPFVDPRQCASRAPFAPATIRLLYDVNGGEGFNLRRDVYVRLAVFVRHVRRQPGWSGVRLVLPPFRRLPHWQLDDDDNDEAAGGWDASAHSWNEFFDLTSLRRYAPVLDAWQHYDEMRTVPTASVIRHVQLVNYDMTDGQFADRYKLYSDQRPPPDAAAIRPAVFGARNYTRATVHRARFQGSVRGLQPLLQALWQRLDAREQADVFTVYLRNAEIVLHDRFGDAEYWRARRSMRFAERLEERAVAFRRDSMRLAADGNGVQRPADWRDEKPFRGARGGAYVCAHLRRRDFLSPGRVEQVPTLRLAAEQIRLVLELRSLRDVFVASDCSGYEFNDLKNYLPHVRLHRYRPTGGAGLSAGAVAIVDQIVCARAAHFVGTFESTFTYRIQEEREVLGFAANATFNTFCGRRAMASGGGGRCERNSRWLIEYEDGF